MGRMVDDSREKISERASEYAAQQSGDFDRDLFYNFKVQDKDHIIRMLPSKVRLDDGTMRSYYGDRGDIAVVVYDHWNIPGSEDNKEKARCIAKTYPWMKVECPICKAMNKLVEWAKEQGLTDSDKKQLGIGKGQNQYRLGSRAYVNGIVRGSDLTQTVEYKGEEIEIPKIRVVGFPISKVFGWVNEQMTARDPDDPSKFDLDPSPLDDERGLDLKVKVKQDPKTKLPDYSCSWRDGRRPIHPDAKIADAICLNGKVLTEMFAFPNDEKVAHMKALADKILGLMGRPLESRKGGLGSDDDSIVGSAVASNGLVGGDGRPGCYTNHLPGDPKCLSCPYEVTCEDEDDTKKKPIEARRKAHADIAAA